MTGFNSKREAAADKLQEPERKALKLATEGLERILGSFEKEGKFVRSSMIRNELFNEIHLLLVQAKKVLAKPAQEPVAHVYLFDHDGRPRIAWDNAKGIKIGDKLYTAPPQGYA